MAKDRTAASAAPRFNRAARLGNAEGFYREAEHVTAVYRARGPLLLVSFCNLSSFALDNEVRLPWVSHIAEAHGWSHLGLMAHRKDWYRNADAPRLLTELRREGFFDGFERVLFTGGSMGGFAALTLSSILPGADVLAFSPQSTLSRSIAPFETRYSWPRKTFDWESEPFLDAARHTDMARQVLILMDPMLPEDRAHSARLSSGRVAVVPCRHMGHMLPNALKRAGVLELVFDMAMSGEFDRGRFYRAFREGRRGMTGWRKALVGHAEAQGRPGRAAALCAGFLREGQGGPWFRKVLARLERETGTGGT